MRFWFEPAGPENLAVCRILFYGSFFLYYLGRDFSAWATVSDVFWMPIWLYAPLSFESLTPGLLNAMQWVWRASLLLACVGLFTRVATIVAFLPGLFLLGLPNNFGMTNHSDGLVVILCLILAVSSCGDRWSLDEVRRRRGRVMPPGLCPNRTPGLPGLADPPATSGEYTWPVRAAQVTFALIFVAAGVSKLKRSGLEWVFSDTMPILLITHQYQNPGTLLSLGLDIARDQIACKAIALGTILLEIGYPLALFHRTSRWIIVPAVFLMQLGIRYVMGPVFFPFLICNLFWAPWDRVIRAAARTVSSSRAPTSAAGSAP